MIYYNKIKFFNNRFFLSLYLDTRILLGVHEKLDFSWCTFRPSYMNSNCILVSWIPSLLVPLVIQFPQSHGSTNFHSYLRTTYCILHQSKCLCVTKETMNSVFSLYGLYESFRNIQPTTARNG